MPLHAGNIELTKPVQPRRRFELEGDSDAATSHVLVDREADDASERRFAASLDDPPPSPRPRFVVQVEENLPAEAGPLAQPADNEQTTYFPANRIQLCPEDSPTDPVEDRRLDCPGPNGDAQAPLDRGQAWRQEVAARVHSYRARRRSRGPKYPSLRLNFGPAESRHVTTPGRKAEPPAPARLASPLAASTQSTARVAQPIPSPTQPVETSAKIIPFPRSSDVPVWRLDELAEPVLESPRIFEVPEVAPPPPALGGILIEPSEEPEPEKRPGVDVPLQSASLTRRMLATLADGMLVLGGFVLFAYVFFRVTAYIPPPLPAVQASLAFGWLFWGTYQYLLLVYAGATPGLWLTGLRLDRFDGRRPPRRLRRWRVLASLLSGLSLGLGHAWCLLDEDALCWHDRITKTYLAPRK